MTKTTSSSSTTILYPNRWKALYILSIVQCLIILDTSIIGVELPTIQQHFNKSKMNYNGYLMHMLLLLVQYCYLVEDYQTY